MLDRISTPAAAFAQRQKMQEKSRQITNDLSGIVVSSKALKRNDNVQHDEEVTRNIGVPGNTIVRNPVSDVTSQLLLKRHMNSEMQFTGATKSVSIDTRPGTQ